MKGKEFAMEREKGSLSRKTGQSNILPSESEIEGILKSPPAYRAPKDKRVVENEGEASV